MNNQNTNRELYDEELEIDLRQLLQIFKKWSKLILTMTLICSFAVGLVSCFVLAPIYQANTLLMVTQAAEKLQTPVNRGESLEDVVSTVSRMPVLTMNTYVAQLKSETLMNRIIKRLNLNPQQYNAYTIAGMIDAQVVKDSNLIEVKITNTDPILAAKIANALSAEYLQFMTENNQEQMSRSVKFLQEQKSATDKELIEPLLISENFRASPGE